MPALTGFWPGWGQRLGWLRLADRGGGQQGFKRRLGLGLSEFWGAENRSQVDIKRNSLFPFNQLPYFTGVFSILLTFITTSSLVKKKSNIYRLRRGSTEPEPKIIRFKSTS